MRGEAAGRKGAGTGGSLALRMVRACLLGGGAKIDAYRLWPGLAEFLEVESWVPVAVIDPLAMELCDCGKPNVGGGAIVPKLDLRDTPAPALVPVETIGEEYGYLLPPAALRLAAMVREKDALWLLICVCASSSRMEAYGTLCIAL